MIFDGSYTRIRQLQLGYTLPQTLLDKIKIKKARFYVSLDDFFTFTKYPGVDPEGGSNGQNSIEICLRECASYWLVQEFFATTINKQ